MKIKNLAFCGVMASILGLTGAYAADATIIASKAYVDARDNLKQDEDKRVTTTLSTYNQTSHTNEQKQADYPSMYTLDTAVSNLSTTIGTNALDTNVLAEGVDGAKLTKASAITAAKSTNKLTTVTDGVASMGAGDDTHFATTKAIADTFKDLDHKTTATNATNASTAVTAVAQADGQVTVTNGTLGIAAIDAEAKETNSVVTSRAADTKVPTVGGVQKGILYWHASNANDGKNMYNPENRIDTEDLAEGKDWNNGGTQTFTGTEENNKFKTDMDAYVPTVAAVEQRVRLAESNASSNLASAADSAASATWNSQNNTLNIVTGDNAGNKTNKLATSAQVNTSVSALKSYADYKIGDTTMGTTATTLTGAIAELGTEKLDKNTAITASTDAMNIVTYDANGLVTGGKKLNNSGLNNINAASGGDNCSASNPCVLTYTGTNYKWTQMDTDSLSAVADGPNS